MEMENFFSRLTLDIIGKAVFNYDFDSLTHDDPVIQARSLPRPPALFSSMPRRPGNGPTLMACLITSWYQASSYRL